MARSLCKRSRSKSKSKRKTRKRSMNGGGAWIPVKYKSSTGATGKARVAFSDVRPISFMVTNGPGNEGGPFNAKIYKSVKNSKFNDDKRSIKVGSYTFFFHKSTNYSKIAKKMKTMK